MTCFRFTRVLSRAREEGSRDAWRCALSRISAFHDPQPLHLRRRRLSPLLECPIQRARVTCYGLLLPRLPLPTFMTTADYP